MIPMKKILAAITALAAAVMLSGCSGGTKAPAEPLDWMTTTCPAHWRTDTGDFTYGWCGDFGADPIHRG